jgi:hypothetical protein
MPRCPPSLAAAVLALSTLAEANLIDGFDVNVVMKNQHPTLVDHERVLTIRRDGEGFAEQELYPDNGFRVPLHVFAEEGKLVFVDCNGDWYELTTADGRFEKLGWRWDAELPEKYLGTFRLRRGRERQTLSWEDGIGPAQTYLFKDPR